MVDVAPGRAAPDPGDLLVRVDPHVVHPRQVDDQTVVHRAEAGNAVAAAADRQVEAAVAAGGDHGHHVGRVHALDDGAGSAVVHAVVDGASVVVVGIRGGDDAPPCRFGQCLDRVAHQVLPCLVSPGTGRACTLGRSRSVPCRTSSLSRPVCGSERRRIVARRQRPHQAFEATARRPLARKTGGSGQRPKLEPVALCAGGGLDRLAQRGGVEAPIRPRCPMESQARETAGCRAGSPSAD